MKKYAINNANKQKDIIAEPLMEYVTTTKNENRYVLNEWEQQELEGRLQQVKNGNFFTNKEAQKMFLQCLM